MTYCPSYIFPVSDYPNYTSPDEYCDWRQVKTSRQYYKSKYTAPLNEPQCQKEYFRTRRRCFGRTLRSGEKYILYHKALRTRIANSNEIGVYLKLTNSYLLVGGDEEHTKQFCNLMKADIPTTPIINTSLDGCKIIGCMCVGNKYGLLVPESISEAELKHIQEGLPDSIQIKKLEEKLSALGNVIACNDHVALVHPDIDKESEEIVADTLQVEVFRQPIANNLLPGSYCVLSNHGGLVGESVSDNAIQDLASLLQLPMMVGTVNNGNINIGSGLVANDFIAYAGMKTTFREFQKIEEVFHLRT